MKIVVIGGVAAGMSAASKAKRNNSKNEVEVYTQEEYISYAACGIPYFVEDLIKDSGHLVARTIEQFAKQGIKIFTGHTVTQIIPEEKKIKVLDREQNKIWVDYDKLIIATGASAVVPPLEGLNLKNIFTVKSITDAEKIKKKLQEGNFKKAVIVGAGYIGLEMVEALSSWELDVTLVELAPQIIGNIDADMAQLVENYLISNGIKVRKEEKVLGFKGIETVQFVKTDKGEIETDLVILAIGVKPNSELAKEAGIQLGVKNAIKVNNRMETNITDIYAAGDCATAYHLVYKDEAYIPLGTTANKQGRVAGDNASGGNSEFPGIVGTAIMKVMEMEIGRTGLSEREAKMLNKEVQEFKIEALAKAHFYPGARKATVKILVDNKSHVIVGAQIVGGAQAAKRIDVLATAVQTGMTVNDVAKLDLSYAPPFSPVWDPVLVAANVAAGKLNNN
jgi:NADPH-dependent 2,4-dienoyl-CoA reductase/sulfur reductase-like enzyme